ncbi:hypothetical protein MLD38_020014 [Melastoma candidum]|uniref:Uncharacterized protein n=1 Tax=Melastoma candidum TaxID=119954 RepID=A0ACB9QEK4_9MYRT|nr:hypothetical protein MLD38_020014 [Melastoma candidum]
MSSFSAARSVLRRASTIRNAASKGSSQATASHPPFRASTSNSRLSSRRIFRSPVEMSFCVETMLPYHTATSSALMNSMLSISQHGYGWLPEGS